MLLQTTLYANGATWLLYKALQFILLLSILQIARH